MNLAGLEQFHQGKGDDKAHRSPLKASQSQVHRREGSADDRPAQARAEIGLRGRGQSERLRTWIDCIPFAFLRSRYDYKDFSSHRCCWICLHLYFTRTVADARRIAFSIANARKASRNEDTQSDARPGDSPRPITLTEQI